MKRITTWSPDTCECVLEYEWDDAVPENERTHAIVNVVKKCEFHQHHSDKDAHFDDVLNENRHKNQVLAEILKNLPEDEKNISVKNGRNVTTFKVNPKWKFDENRVLQVELTSKISKTLLKNNISSILERDFQIK
jgi:hypothetical protein